MAAVGPHRVEGHDWRTDAAGNITRTQPERVIAEVVRTPSRRRVIEIRDRMIANRDSLNEQIAEMTAERDQLDTEIPRLQDIIDNARA